MYAWLWRRLPGPRWARVLQAVLLASLVVLALFLWVFPIVTPLLPFDQVTLEGNASQ